MKAIVVELGQRFGKLVVTESRPSNNQGRRWLCVCDCGGRIIAASGQLNNGRIKSCGCGQKNAATIRHLWAR